MKRYKFILALILLAGISQASYADYTFRSPNLGVKKQQTPEEAWKKYLDNKGISYSQDFSRLTVSGQSFKDHPKTPYPNKSPNAVVISNSDISNLDFLSGTTEIGNLSVSNTPITSLSGLGSLTEAGSISFMQISLSSLSGLDNLKRIDNSFLVAFGSDISLHGIESLEYVGGQMRFDYFNLYDLSPLNNLQYVGQIMRGSTYFTTKLNSSAWLCQPGQAGKWVKSDGSTQVSQSDYCNL